MNCSLINGKNGATLLMDGPKFKGKTLSDDYWRFLYYCLQTYFIILLYFQARIRGLQARLRHQNLVRNAKAKIIQTNLRGWLARKKYQRSIRRVVQVQCQVRRFLAKKQFKKLKIEAKSIHHQKKLNKGTVIQNKLISSGKSRAPKVKNFLDFFRELFRIFHWQILSIFS